MRRIPDDWFREFEEPSPKDKMQIMHEAQDMLQRQLVRLMYRVESLEKQMNTVKESLVKATRVFHRDLSHLEDIVYELRNKADKVEGKEVSE